MGRLKTITPLSKRANAALILFAIYVAQVSTAATIYNLANVTEFASFWLVIYYLLTLIGAVPQTGFSDLYGRKRHLLIAATTILGVLGYLLLAMLFVPPSHSLRTLSWWSWGVALPICLGLGLAGNLIPIARGGLVDLKVHNFRTAVGLSTVLIGFGWITVVLMSLAMPSAVVLTLCVALQATTLILLKRCLSEPLHIQAPLRVPSWTLLSIRHNIKTIVSSYRWTLSMFLVAGGASALLAYLFSESAFYPIYSLKEEGTPSFNSKIIGTSMALGYAAGVAMLWLSRCSDRMGIRIGVPISLVFIIAVYLLKLFFAQDVMFFERFVFLEMALDFVIALGFGFSVPSLFSIMSSNIRDQHAGKLFGAIDTTDTVALGISSYVLYLKDSLRITELGSYNVVLVCFVLSYFFYRSFLRRFSSYEKRPDPRS